MMDNTEQWPGTPIGIVGAGVMGAAMARAFLRDGLVGKEDVLAAEPVAERRQAVAAELGIRVTVDNRDVARQCRTLILSVKPQSLKPALASLRDDLSSDALVISIVAGVRLSVLSKGLGNHPSIVRAMPNTPAQIGKGMTVWTGTLGVSEPQKAWAQRLLAAMGDAVWVADEGDLDRATALSGSGPAYVFLFLEALVDAGVHLGFPRPLAERLVLQTVEGALLMARQSGQHPAILRNNVTSPAGTTAEALHHLEAGGFRSTLAKAVWAAYERSKALGRLSDE